MRSVLSANSQRAGAARAPIRSLGSSSRSHFRDCNIWRAPTDAQFLTPLWRSFEAFYQRRKLSQNAGHVLSEVALVEKVVAYGDRLLQASDAVPPVSRH